jgi:hypothetical protein
MTLYRLAATPADYGRCRLLIGAAKPLRFPTVMAERDGVLVGVLGTEAAYPDKIVAGPLVVSAAIPNPAFLTVRLIDAYETELRRAGVKAYLFCTGLDNHRFVRWIQALGGREVSQCEGYRWYWREVA